MATIVGKIIKVFVSKGGWSSCLVSCDNGETISCAGSIPGAIIGMRIKAEGEYSVHEQYGKQFSVSTSELETAYTKEFALRYLGSGAIKGVGPERARKIVSKFGDETMRIIESDDYLQLAEVSGISKRAAKNIHESFLENNVFRKLLGYANLSINKADALYRHYAQQAVDIIKNHPYKIIYDINGFGFKTVDEIALKNGFTTDHPERIAAAITYQLTKIAEEGHCFCSVNSLEKQLDEIIPEISNKVRSQILVSEIKNGNIIFEDGNIVYAKRYYDAENIVAKVIASMLSNKVNPFPAKTIEKAIKTMESKMGFELESQQKTAISTALNNRICVITGGPGTGKSTIINAIVNSWLSYNKNLSPEECIVLCSPTGKASRRMFEITGVTAETVQRIVLRNTEDFPIENSLIIVDESSMLDLILAKKLLQLASNNDNRIVFIGDANQLPPIGPGSFFLDLINSPCVPAVTLQLCHRQSGTIATNAKLINEGRGYNSLDFTDPSCQFIYSDKYSACETVLNEYRNLLTQYGVTNVCILVPIRKSGRSHTSADELNRIIREEINPILPGEKTLENCDFREGDRVMYTSNDYEKGIFNGDCGIVQELDTEFSKVCIEMDDGREIELSVSQSKSLVLAYAITVHKSQGSEYKGVVIAQNREHAFMLQRNLLYTALTRAKERVIIVGEPAAINMAVTKIPSLERQTKLRVRIGEAIASHK